MKKSISAVAIAAVLLFAAFGSVEARPFDILLVKNRVCMSGAQVAFVDEFVRRSSSLVKERVAAKKDLGNSTKSMPALDSASCVFSQPSELLSDKQGLLPAIYGVSIHAVVDYQKSRTKEPGPETGSARTQTLVYTYGKNYVVVVTSAIPDLSDKTIPLNCQSVAYFRVEPSTGRVLQYDGCVEAHVRTLPTFSELPA